MSGLGAKITGAISSFLAGVGGTIVTACATIAAGVVSFFAGAEIGKTVGSYLFPDDKELYDGYSGIKGTLELVKDTFVAIYDDIDMKNQKASAALTEKWEDLKKAASTKFSEMKTNITNALNDIVTSAIQRGTQIYEAIKNPFETLKQFILNLINSARTWGYNLITAIANGITGGSSNLINAFGTAVKNAAENAFNNSLIKFWCGL